MNHTEHNPDVFATNVLLAAINGASSLVTLSDRYGQPGMYFRGYLDGLQYALAVLSAAVYNESEVSTNDHA